MKKLNNNGFTLVELLAVLVILITIMSIAIPTISSSLERSKDSQNKQKQKLLESAAELYVADHKNDVFAKLNSNDNNCCKITLGKLKKEEYVDADAIKDVDGNNFNSIIVRKTENGLSITLNDICAVDCVE